MLKTTITAIASSLILALMPQQAQAVSVTIYDGASNTLPNAQNWQFQNLPGGAIASVGSGVTNLDTTLSPGIAAGYAYNPLLGGTPFPLNRTQGYTISFNVQVLSEDHTSSGTADNNGDGIADRAGFSIIALSSDKRGIELGFWTDRIWAQQDGVNLFIQGEGVNFNTTNSVTYDLVVSGNNYQLWANGGLILTGALRDYTPFIGPIDPYETPNFLFLGDDTTSASANINLAKVVLTDQAIPFEFSPGLGLLILGGWLGIKQMKLKIAQNKE